MIFHVWGSLAFGQVHSGTLRFHELDAFVDGVTNGGPLEQKLQAGYWGNGQLKVSAVQQERSIEALDVKCEP